MLAARFTTLIIVGIRSRRLRFDRRSFFERGFSHGEELAGLILRFGAIGERWSRFWRGEYDRDTLRSVPSWGVSVLLHSLLLLLLALAIQIEPPGASPGAYVSGGGGRYPAWRRHVARRSQPGGRSVHHKRQPRPAVAGAGAGRPADQARRSAARSLRWHSSHR